MTTNETVGMKMAKADEADMLALLDVVSIVEQLAKGYMPTLTNDRGDGKPEGEESDETARFDRDRLDHCQRVLDMLLRADGRGGLFRAAFGLTVLLSPRNGLVDPDVDYIKKHPRILRALALLEQHEAGAGANPQERAGVKEAC